MSAKPGDMAADWLRVFVRTGRATTAQASEALLDIAAVAEERDHLRADLAKARALLERLDNANAAESCHLLAEALEAARAFLARTGAGR